MKKAIKSPKAIGLFCIFFLIGYVILNKNFQLKHPLLSWGIVYCILPAYLFILVKNKLGKKAPVKRNIQKPPPQNNYDDYDNFDNFQVQKVDRLEKKTTTTNTTTTVTTETIYFKGNGYEE